MSCFDKTFGDGTLNKLISELEFENVVPECTRDLNVLPAEIIINDEPNIGELILDWNSDKFIAGIQISYSESYWLFINIYYSLPNGQDENSHYGFVGKICSVIPKFAKDNTSAKIFYASASDENISKMYSKVGWTRINQTLSFKNDLYEFYKPTSKLEEYGEWYKSGKNPDLEPSWRKEIDNG